MSAHRKIHQRDKGLRRVSRITNWTIALGIGLSVLFASLAQQAFAQTVRQRAVVAAASRSPIVRNVTPTSTPTPTSTTPGDDGAGSSTSNTPTTLKAGIAAATPKVKHRRKRLTAATTTPRVVVTVPRWHATPTIHSQWVPPQPVTSGGS